MKYAVRNPRRLIRGIALALLSSSKRHSLLVQQELEGFPDSSAPRAAP